MIATALFPTTVSGVPIMAPIVQNNCKTVWVQLRDGNIIKRHKIKHARHWAGEVYEERTKAPGFWARLFRHVTSS